MSLRRYLVLMLISVLTLVTFAAAIRGYQASMRQAGELFDTELTSLAGILSSLPANISPTHLHNDSQFAFQIWHDGKLTWHSDDIPDTQISPWTEGFSEQNFHGQRWQTYAISPSPAHWIIVAQPLSHRFELAEQVILTAVMPLIVSIPLLALLVFVTISRGLHPLSRLSRLLRSKKADDLSAVRIPQAPSELKPVLATMNDLFRRLDSAFQREKRFASDAAHELRTPLSVLKINSHNLESELASREIDSLNMRYLQLGVERMSHVVDQILLLNRTNPEQYAAKFVKVNLLHLCQNIIASLYPQIEQKQQDISLEGDNALISGDEFALGILLQNLVSNASKYTPEKGQLLVSLEPQDEKLLVYVDDSGPGIPEDQYERVFERFYRVGGDRHQSQEPGCGLGLAIVRHIAQLHGATLQLAKSPLGGLRVCVVFRLVREGVA